MKLTLRVIKHSANPWIIHKHDVSIRSAYRYAKLRSQRRNGNPDVKIPDFHSMRGMFPKNQLTISDFIVEILHVFLIIYARFATCMIFFANTN